MIYKYCNQLIFSILALFCFANFSKAQSYRFENIPAELGLANMGVNDIIEDKDGYLWLATWSGLARYDGYEVKMFRQEPGNVHGLKSNKVTCLFEDSQGQLWVGTSYTGFYRYDQGQNTFVHYQTEPDDMNSLSDNNVWAIFEDSQGRYWVGTENGLNRFDPASGKFVHYHHDPNDSRSLSNNFVYSINESIDGSIWAGSEEGLNRITENPLTGQELFVRYDLAPPEVNEDDYLAHNFIYKIYPSRYQENLLWICTSIGLKEIYFSPEDLEYLDFKSYLHNEQSKVGLSHRFVSDVWEENDNKVWIATYDGLNLLTRKSNTFEYFDQDKKMAGGLSNNIVHSLFADHTSNLWIGMDKGVNKMQLHPNSFNVFQFEDSQGSENDIISSLALSSDGKGIWAGMRGSGLRYFQIKEGTVVFEQSQHYKIGSPKMDDLAGFTSSLIVDRNGDLWIGTHGAGVIRISESEVPSKSSVLRNMTQFTKSDVLSDDYLMSLFESKSGDIWLGYWDKGLSRYDPETEQFQHFLTTRDLSLNLEAFPVVQLFETENNGQSNLWVGTRGGGIYKLHFEKESGSLNFVQHFQYDENEPASLSNNFTNGFLQDQHERLWVSTESGLNVLNASTGKFRSFLEKDGLANTMVTSMLSDDNDMVWVSTESGISSVIYEEGKVEIRNHDMQSGFFFMDDAAVKTASGDLIFGGIDGLVHFKPNALETDPYPPQVAITDFKLFNQSVPLGKLENGRTLLNKDISQTEKIELTHRDNVLSFEFVGLQLTDPDKIRYAYQLEGFDEDWVFANSDQRNAHYTNLPYDDFVFRVKASNGDGVWSEPVSLRLTVNPPFWQTGWAYLIYIALFVVLLLGVRKITKIRENYKHRIELEHLEREKLKEVNQLKLQFFTNISHEIRTPLTLIVSPLEQLIQERGVDAKMHKLFTRMHFNANRLLVMINQLLDIRKSEAGLMKLKVSEGDLVSFSKEVMLSFKSLAAQRSMTLTFTTQKEKIITWYDPDQLEKVLYNLLSNAFKFTPEGKKISIHLEENAEKNEVIISVKDQGQGIPANELPHIFDRFYQVEKSQEWLRKGGTGIGLSLLKNIVEAHHGKVQVESEVGLSTIFHIILKKGKEHFSENQLASHINEQSDVSNYILSNEEFDDGINYDGGRESDVQPTTAPAKKMTGFRKSSILIVEDNPDIREYLRENLEEEFEVEEADDGSDGLEKAIANPPDLILADIAMPKMDGIEMCGKMKSDINTSHVPIILLTARSSLVFKIDGLETGADDYITKPFNLRLLKTRIRNLIKSRQDLREKFAKNIDLSPKDVVIHSLDEKLIAQLKTVVERHIDDSEFSVEKLAKALNLSRMQLYRKLKALTGKSPNQIIRSLRLKRAVQLLSSKQYNISEVTYMVGYNDLKSFREQFKKEFGVSPSEYEKEE